MASARTKKTPTEGKKAEKQTPERRSSLPKDTDVPPGKQDTTERKKRAYRRRMKSTANVRCFLSDIARQLEADEIDPKKAGSLTYVAQTLLSAVKAETEEKDLRAQIKDIRAALKNKGGSR